jgi:hypothetical protein
MAATCAACLTEISKGDPFVLSGTEVFHRRCSRQIERSIGARQRMVIADLKAKVLEERRIGAEARIDAQSAESRVAELERDLVQAKRRAGEEQARSNRAELAETNLQRDLRVQRTAATLERNNFLRELDQLRSENQRLSSEVLRRAKDDLPVPAQTDLRDATEIRFSLLEIDEP